jgi:hypothetical protein
MGSSYGHEARIPSGVEPRAEFRSAERISKRERGGTQITRRVQKLQGPEGVEPGGDAQAALRVDLGFASRSFERRECVGVGKGAHCSVPGGVLDVREIGGQSTDIRVCAESIEAEEDLAEEREAERGKVTAFRFV